MQTFRNQFIKQGRSCQIEQIVPIILIFRRKLLQTVIQQKISGFVSWVHGLVMNSREKIVQCFHFLFSKKTEFYQFFFQIGTIGLVRVCSTGTADNGKMLGEAFPVMYLYQGRHQFAPG